MARANWRCAAAVLEAARFGQLPIAPLLAGLPFDEATLGRQTWIEWDDYCVLLERLERAYGGPAGVARVLDRQLPFREMHAVAGAFVSPALLYRFVFQVIDPLMFPALTFSYDELPDGRLRIAYDIAADARACSAVGRCSLPAIRALPRYLGLPPSTVEAELGDRSGVYCVTLPRSQTLAARVRRRYRPKVESLIAMLSELNAEIGREPRPRPATVAPPSLDERLRQQAAQRRLTPRQSQVLSGLLNGLSNKEIAERDRCSESTIEFHVTYLLTKFRVRSRAQLLSSFWRD